MREISLNEQKQLMLEILKEFESFCTSHGLSYFLVGGTLLGAVRHKGYIPWDDDIDVGMPRKDYEIFVDLYNKEKTNKDYEFVSFHQNPDFYMSCGKLINTKTAMEEAVDSTVEMGVNIDVFPLDNFGNTREEAERIANECLKVKKALNVQNWKIIKERAWYKNVVIFLIKAVAPKGKRRQLVQQLDQLSQKYAADTLTAYVGFPTGSPKPEILKREWVENTITVPFEQYEFRIPKEYDRVLNVFYGPTYMELPPAEKQKTHHAYSVWYKD